ncbi:MAG: GLPGLI family protein [Rhizobacter sp.]|nr:GLPGLI family protein [Ferruginibacter sp.]
MKNLFAFIFLLITTISFAWAQDFITRGKIEFEVKRNIKRIVSAQQGAGDGFLSSLPEFDISYRDLIFSWNQSIYQPGRKNLTSVFPSSGEVYIDLEKRQSIRKSRFIDEEYVLADTLQKIRWKIENETRKIAGWECRKAVGRIYDSVYVVAFYCPEMIPQGGPELFSGLPGMILGLAIPRQYTTWFATKIEIANIDETKIVPPVIKKNKQYNKKELAEIMLKKFKDSGMWKDATLERVLQSMSSYTLQ